MEPSASCARRLAGGTSSALLDLQPELLEHVAALLPLADLTQLASTCHSATPLHLSVVGLRIAALRQVMAASRAELAALIEKLPRCPARTKIAAVIESSLQTFDTACTCNEDFLQLSTTVALRGQAGPFSSPVEAARIARSCCRTCDDVTSALTAVKSWLRELANLVAGAGRQGERALIDSDAEQQHPQQQAPEGVEHEAAATQLADEGEMLATAAESAAGAGVGDSSGSASDSVADGGGRDDTDDAGQHLGMVA